MDKCKKYYLLVFCEDYADEHNVPAIACMTKEEYDIWLESPSGKLNPNFEKELQKYKDNEELSNIFWSTLKKENITNTSLIPKNREDLVKLEKNYRDNYKYLSYPNRVNSNMNAFLGNSGDCFEESFSNLYLMKEFVEQKIVEVTEVDKSFYDTFHKVNLSQINLCNVFEITKL